MTKIKKSGSDYQNNEFQQQEGENEMKLFKTVIIGLAMLLGSSAIAAENTRVIDYKCKFKYDLPKHGWVWCGVYGDITVRGETTDQTLRLKCLKGDERVLTLRDDVATLTREGLILTLHGEDAKDEVRVRFVAPRELPATVDAVMALNEDDFAKGACRFEDGDEEQND